MRDGTRRGTRAFTHLHSHYWFRDRFGRPGKGNDKDKIETLMKKARRRFLVPIPKVHDLSALNERLTVGFQVYRAAEVGGMKDDMVTFRLEDGRVLDMRQGDPQLPISTMPGRRPCMRSRAEPWIW